MDGIEMVAQLMAISATTAPKSKGENFVKTRVLKGKVLRELADAMMAYGQRTKKKDFDRDSKNVAASDAVLLVGIKRPGVLGLDCGACGFADCKTFQQQKKQSSEFIGPTCAFRLLDMGIALGSAVKTASMLNVDNRIMYRIGVAVREMDLVDWEFVIGIPLSVTGKSIYFDR
ncbi:MAG: ferredoxin domain-containing protein [Desulfobacterales bacterium]